MIRQHKHKAEVQTLYLKILLSERFLIIIWGFVVEHKNYVSIACAGQPIYITAEKSYLQCVSLFKVNILENQEGLNLMDS